MIAALTKERDKWVAMLATDANVRANYANLASQWAEMAEQAEELGERRLALLRRLSTLSITP